MTTKKPRGIGVDFQAQTRYRRGQLPASRSRVAPPFKAYANPHEIATLPAPQLKGGTGVWTALSSARGGESEGGRIKQALLSQVLWAGAGFTVGRERVLVTAHGVSSIEMYVLARNVQDIFAGVYHYDSREHSLAHIEVGDPTDRLADALLAPLDLGTQAAVVCFTGIPLRHSASEGGRSFRYLYLDAGAAAQDAVIAGTALGLATHFIADFYDDELVDLLQLDSRNEFPLCLVAVGS